VELTPEELRQFVHFQVFAPSDLDWLGQNLQLQSLQSGEQLLQEGQASPNLYFLRQGTLIPSISNPQDQTTREFAPLAQGEIIGEMSFLDDSLPSATITAQESSQVLVLPKSCLSQQLQQDRGFGARFYHMLALKLSQQLQAASRFLTQQQQVIFTASLRKVLLAFAVLNDVDVDWLTRHGLVQTIVPGHTLITAQTPLKSIYILLEGTLGIYIPAADSPSTVTEKEVGLSLKGEILGEISFIEAGLASATVKAKETCRVLSLPWEQLATKLETDQSFASRFYRSISIVLANRYRDRLRQRGLSYLAQQDPEAGELAEDELDLEVLEETALGSVRFDWMLRQLS
jgi:bacteriocin-type transport-associated protein